MPIETVKIKSSQPDHQGYIIINKSDFDPNTHELWEEESEPKHADPAKHSARGEKLHLKG